MKRILSLALIFTLCLALFACKPKEEDPLLALDDNSETVAALKSVMAELGYEVSRDNDRDYFRVRMNDLNSKGTEFSEEDMSGGYAIFFTHPERGDVIAMCFNTRALARSYYDGLTKHSTTYEKTARREGGVVIIGDRDDLSLIKI